MPDVNESLVVVEKAADAVRARVQDTLLNALEHDILGPVALLPNRHVKVDTVVSEIRDLNQLELADEGLSSIGDLDDEQRFQEFAQQLMHLRQEQQ